MKNLFNLQGTYEASIIGVDGKIKDTWVFKNIVVDEGLKHVLETVFMGGAQVANWYLGVFKNNYTPVSGDTMSTFPSSGVAGEATTEYSETARPQCVFAGTGTSRDNAASLAIFSFTSGATIYGAFLASDNTKGGTTGTLLSAGKFSAPKTVAAGETLQVKYTITASDV